MDINAVTETVTEALRQRCPDQDIQTQAIPIADTFITLPPDCVHEATALLIERFDVYHLSTITGQDTGDTIELLYHFWEGDGLTLRTRLPREAPRIATLTDIIPGAAFYEREIWEMLGVAFEGHPDLSLFLLPEDWDGAPPLRNQGAEDGDEGEKEEDKQRENQEDEQ